MTAPIHSLNTTQFFGLVKNNVTLTERFLAYVNVHSRDHYGTNALYWAIKNHNLQNVIYLVHRGISLRVDNKTHALFFAVEEDNLSVIKFFIDKGIDVNICDNHYQTLLIHAVKRNRVDICRYLLSEGANPFLLDHCNNMAIDYAKSKEIREMLESY